jgi:hypothetical protein
MKFTCELKKNEMDLTPRRKSIEALTSLLK